MNDYVIEARQITKKYRSVPALNQVNLGVQPGSIYGLIGDNGAGKSTLLKLLAGHIFPTAGEIRLFGCSGEKELLRSRRQMGVMIERPGFFPNMTVERTLEYYRIQKGVPAKKRWRNFWNYWASGKSAGRDASACPWARSSGWASPSPCLGSPSC